MKIPVKTESITRHLGRALGAVGKMDGVPGATARVAMSLLSMDDKSPEDRIMIALRPGPQKISDLVTPAGGAAALPLAIENLHKLRLITTEDIEGDLIVSLTQSGTQVADTLK